MVTSASDPLQCALLDRKGDRLIGLVAFKSRKSIEFSPNFLDRFLVLLKGHGGFELFEELGVADDLAILGHDVAVEVLLLDLGVDDIALLLDLFRGRRRRLRWGRSSLQAGRRGHV